MHLIDLARWFLGDFVHIQGYAATYFWDMPVDDNSFYLLVPKRIKRPSCTQVARSGRTHSVRIYGKDAKLEISGLGGSYGVERLSYYQMKPEMGPPETTIFEYPMADDSWSSEWQAFAKDIEMSRPPSPGLEDAQAALRIVEAIYKESETGK